MSHEKQSKLMNLVEANNRDGDYNYEITYIYFLYVPESDSFFIVVCF